MLREDLEECNRLESRGYPASAAILREAYARRLDAELAQVGNDQSAMNKLNAALEAMPDYDEEESDPSEWPNWTDDFTWELTDDTPEWHEWLERSPLID
jgi:hypothetical protein